MPPIVTQTSPKSSPNTTRARSQTTPYTTTSSRYEPPVVSAAPIFPSRRFGASPQCPGCNLAVSQMERGVVPGPSGSRWHATCLVCGGKEARGRRKEDGKAGCGKKLDSAAKTDATGNVWCRECLVSAPAFRLQLDMYLMIIQAFAAARATPAVSRPLTYFAQYNRRSRRYRPSIYRQERCIPLYRQKRCTSVHGHDHYCTPVHGSGR